MTAALITAAWLAIALFVGRCIAAGRGPAMPADTPTATRKGDPR